MNVKKAAIHYHFPSKNDLGVAVIRRAHGHLDDVMPSSPTFS